MGIKFDTENFIKFGDLQKRDTFVMDHHVYMKTEPCFSVNCINLYSAGLGFLTDDTIVQPVNIFARVERI